MDFTFTAEQDDAAELAAQILKDRCTPERLREVEADRRPLRPRSCGRSWATPACSASPSRRRTAAPAGTPRAVQRARRGRPRGGAAPARVGTGRALAIAELGTDDQQRAVAAARGDGRAMLTAALAEDRDSAPDRPTTTAAHGRRRLDAHRREDAACRAGTVADLFLVPAEHRDGVARLPGPTPTTPASRDPAQQHQRRRRGRPRRARPTSRCRRPVLGGSATATTSSAGSASC